jgi:membrane-associated phospholipid phosphatase
MTTVALAIVASMLSSEPSASKASPDDRPIGRAIVRHTGHDLRGMIAAPALLVIGTGAMAALAARPRDRDVTRSVAANDALERVLEPGNAIGDGYLQIAAAAATWIAGRATHHPRLAATGADLVEAHLLNGAFTQGLKYAVPRDRPDGGRNSFPSGHTSATFTTAAVIQHRFGWKAGVAAYAVGAYVGAARLGERQHYLSDVLFGAALGAAAGRAVAAAHNPRARLTATAIPLKGGFAVVLAR